MIHFIYGCIISGVVFGVVNFWLLGKIDDRLATLIAMLEQWARTAKDK